MEEVERTSDGLGCPSVLEEEKNDRIKHFEINRNCHEISRKLVFASFHTALKNIGFSTLISYPSQISNIRSLIWTEPFVIALSHSPSSSLCLSLSRSRLYHAVRS